MSTKLLMLERLQEDLFIKVYTKQMLNEVFTGNKSGENEYEWDVNSASSIKDKAKTYFNNLKSKYISLAPSAQKKLKAAAIASIFGLITLNNTDTNLDATEDVIKQDIENIANKILPKKEIK